nr:pleckstrin y domain containing family M [Hymenolepis microstoma]
MSSPLVGAQVTVEDDRGNGAPNVSLKTQLEDFTIFITEFGTAFSDILPSGIGSADDKEYPFSGVVVMNPIDDIQNTWTKGGCYGYFDDILEEEELRNAEVGPRYYIHHHKPGKNCRKDDCENCDVDPLLVSTRGLLEILQADNMEIVKPSAFKKVKSTANALRLKFTKKEKEKIIVGSELRVPTGHVLTPATCTKYAGICEGCRSSVFRTRYFYCKNCPVVIHNLRNCKYLLKSRCPAPELGIFGWGEGKTEPKKMLRQVYDLNDIMLSEPVNDNECGGCGCILDPSKGHPCPPSTQPDLKEPHTDLKGPFKGLRRGIFKVLNGEKGKSTKPKLECAKKIYTCHFTKKRYCENCHWNDQWYIPPSMIHINDYCKEPVCRAAYLKLRVLWDTAVVVIPEEWFLDSDMGRNFYQVRKKLKLMMRYISVCSIAQSMRKYLDYLHAPHLLECCTLLRMVDLCHVIEGDLYAKLKEIEKIFEGHVTKCSMCLSINLKCCVCHEGEPLFYYADDVGICKKCDRPYHLACELQHHCE